MLFHTALINIRKVQGGRNGAGSRRVGVVSSNKKDIKLEAQGDGRNDRISVEAAMTGIGMEQVTAPEEKRAYVSAHGLWKRGTTAMFDSGIINVEAVS